MVLYIYSDVLIIRISYKLLKNNIIYYNFEIIFINFINFSEIKSNYEKSQKFNF